MKPVQILAAVKAKKDLERKQAENLYRMQKDMSSSSPSCAPIIV